MAALENANKLDAEMATVVSTASVCGRVRLIAIFCSAAWFALNIAIANVNKWIFYKYHYDYPLFLTTMHMIFCWVLGFLSQHFFLGGVVIPSSKVLMKVATLALTFCISVAAGNMSLKYLYPSFTQMIGATTPFVTVILDRLVMGTRHSTGVFLSLIPMCLGCMLCVYGEVNFHFFGFICTVVATILRGLKTVLGALLMSGEEKLAPMNLLFLMSMMSSCFLFLGTLVFERELFSDPATYRIDIMSFVVLSSLVSFFLNLMNLLVTFYLGSVALAVLGNLKVIVSIFISLLIYQNAMGLNAWLGCVITLSGVALHSRLSGKL